MSEKFKIPKIVRSHSDKKTKEQASSFRERYLEVLSNQFTGVQEKNLRRAQSGHDIQGEGLTLEQVKEYTRKDPNRPNKINCRRRQGESH